MRRIAAIMFALGVFGLSAMAQSERSVRPRIASTPVIPVPVQTDDSSNKNKTRRAPVLNNNQINQVQIPDKTENVVDEDADEIIRVETNLVSMPVSVLDRNGRFIPGLQQKDFQIFENGVQQKIDYFQSVEQPFTVVLMIDISPSTRYQINDIRLAAIKFVDQLRPNDKVMVVTFDEKIYVMNQPTNDRRILYDAIMRTNFGEGTSLYGAVNYVVKQRIPQIEGRKAVVLFTDGVDTTSGDVNYESTVRDVEEVDALFYPIRYDTMSDMNGGSTPSLSGSVLGLGGISGIIVNGKMIPTGSVWTTGTSRAEYDTGRRYLDDLAQKSGGRKFEAENNLDAAFSGIAEELRRQYSIGYYPETVGQSGERRQIIVRVNRPNVAVRTKTSYVVGSSVKNESGK
jgi:Ca-activated chloride channel family protein